MITLDEKVLDKAKKTLADLAQSWDDGGVCKGTVMTMKGGGGAAKHTACHSWLPSDNYGESLILNCVSKKRSKGVCSPESLEFLVKWMARESPFSDWILNRDDDESLEHGVIIHFGGEKGLNRNETMWVCKVLRFGTEGMKAAETFMTLVQGGVDPMLALYVASHIRTIRGATFGYTGPDGHSTVCGKVFSHYENNFRDAVYVETSPVGLISKNLDRRATSTGILFKEPEKVPASVAKAAKDPETRVKGFCKPIKKDDGWGGTVNTFGIDKDVLIQRVLEWEKELKAEKIEVPAPKLPTKNTVYLDLDM